MAFESAFVTFDFGSRNEDKLAGFLSLFHAVLEAMLIPIRRSIAPVLKIEADSQPNVRFLDRLAGRPVPGDGRPSIG